MPDGFSWDTLVLDDPLVLKELYTLLTENYVEDDDAMFRFDYPSHFLKWYISSFRLITSMIVFKCYFLNIFLFKWQLQGFAATWMEKGMALRRKSHQKW